VISQPRHFALAAVVAAFFVASPRGLQAADKKAFGQYLSSECVTCHQISGQFDGIPPIIGWPEKSFVDIMMQYRGGQRSNPVMRTIAGKLTEEEIAALAVYFGSLNPPPRAR
jgi:cytochrome c553